MTLFQIPAEREGFEPPDFLVIYLFKSQLIIYMCSMASIEGVHNK